MDEELDEEINLEDYIVNAPLEVLDFVGSEEEFQMIKDIGNFIGVTGLEDERMINVSNLVYDLVVYKKLGSELKETIKNHLNFLDEEKINALESYLQEKYQSFIEDIWKKAELKEKKEEKIEENRSAVWANVEKIEQTKEETFEEKEKRYIEMMNKVMGVETKEEAKEERLVTAPSVLKEAKEVIVTWKETEKPEELPEGTIVIKKKEEERKVEKKEDLLDLSNL